MLAVVLTMFLASRFLAWASTTFGVALLSAVNSAQAASIAAATPPSTSGDPVILKRADVYRNAVLAGDASAVISLFRDDAIEMPPFQPPVSGRAAIQDFYRHSFAAPMKVTAFTFDHTETMAQGDVAYDVGTYKRTMSGTAGVIEVHGTYIVILKRTGPNWKIAYITYTFDAPPPQ
jgi:ketosteroid isomerase-like protein